MESKTFNLAAKAAVSNWKAERSLFGLINYCSRNFKTDKDLRTVLSVIPELKTAKSGSDVKTLLSIDLVKSIFADKVYKMQRNESGKLIATTEERKIFSLFTFAAQIRKTYLTK